MPQSIYIFSGLGADERAFQNLDFPGYTAFFIKWTIPDPKDSIENYATRLLDQINTKRPILIGLSFGGLMAIEVAKQIDTEKIILIASAKTKKEIPFYFRFAGRLRLHKTLPTRLLKSSNFMTNWFFGARSMEDKKLLKQILSDTNPTFLKWGIDKIVRWANLALLQNIYHIHGTSDRIFPLRFINCDTTIKNGGHLMTLNKAKELNTILIQHL